MSDNNRLLVHTIPTDRGPQPKTPAVPSALSLTKPPEKVSRMATFQDLLKTPDDEQLFATTP